eukprot:CAMPEP_0172533246 /NCGR_PEP_ID=MMETSP1067-20121228/6021_1 /TAXON_ID=265564 ORGANISM="Thalassiosira punctigera, Strain Tpunct2005C2" /NCGR_SAMPLE_ID=MMETSP1067 /ASSEMBLY_ACC=CAM_ASM_000444 /LENGTH=173 /DNA_ID=CAMNT_0013317869 /DNA_START=77 /DNA_END=595 /DNA_ORIENTATION=-
MAVASSGVRCGEMYVVGPPVGAGALSTELGEWCTSYHEALERGDVVHASLEGDDSPVSPATRDVALRLHAAIDGAMLLPMASESDMYGRAVVIRATDPEGSCWGEGERLPDEKVLHGALGLKEEADDVTLSEETILEAKDDLTTDGKCMWCGGYDYDDDDENDDDEDVANARR